MKADGIVNFGTDLDNPDFAEIARAVGLLGARVEHPGELDDALRAAFAHPGPAVVDVVTARQELALPPKITFEQARGFTLWATRSVLSGDGNAVLDVAKTNLRQLALERSHRPRRTTMEYLVTMTTRVPDGDSPTPTVAAMRAREAAHTAELARAGRVVRLCAPRSARTNGPAASPGSARRPYERPGHRRDRRVGHVVTAPQSVFPLRSSTGVALLAATVLASTIGFLNAYMINVAVPAIGRDLHAGVSAASSGC